MKKSVSVFVKFASLAIVVTTVGLSAAQAKPNVLRVGPGQPFAKIQDAVNTARSGDTILVYPASYSESVSVTKNHLNIVAQGSGVVVNPQPLQKLACFEVKADQVVIRGFELTGTMMAPGIRFEGSHNEFSENRIYELGGLGVNALNCRDADGGSDDNLIANNTITGADLGIVVGSDSETTVNKNNRIIGNSINGMGTVGIAVYNAVDCTVADNVIENVGFGLGISIIALMGDVPQHGHKVIGNRVIGTAEAGIGVFADETTALSKVTISGNQVGLCGGYGIILQKDPGATLEDNVITDNQVSEAQLTGIVLTASVNKNKIDSNVVTKCGIYGIHVNGDRNKITRNTALESGTYDLANGGTDNQWKHNVYETSSW